MLTPLAALLTGDSAVGAFNVITLEYAEAIVAAAEAVELPVVLSVSHNAVRYHGALAPIAAACVALAEQSRSSVGLHLDHCDDEGLIRECADLGFGSAMFDAATLPYGENVRDTARVAEFAHGRGLWLEAELGEIGGKDGAHAPGVRTDPEQARQYVKSTGVDGLAVAVGTSHAMTERTRVPDLELIERLAAAVPVPLVLHGSSGVPEELLRAAVSAGIRKVNVGTQLSIDYSDTLRAALNEPQGPDPRTALRAARARIESTVSRLLGVIHG